MQLESGFSNYSSLAASSWRISCGCVLEDPEQCLFCETRDFIPDSMDVVHGITFR